jgi:GH24 family phage-related lysozyme (muramidase)
MSAINPTNNTGLIVDEFISYATNHLNSVKGTIYTTSLYPPVGTPNIGVLNWVGYIIAPTNQTNVVTQDDFKPKEDIQDQNSVRPTQEETIAVGTTEQKLDETVDKELEEFLRGPQVIAYDSGVAVSADKFSTGKPFVQGPRGGGGFQSAGTGVAVDLGELDLTADWITIAAKYIAKNEGFADRATWDANAYRLGFGTDSIIGSDGKVRKVQPPPSYHKETGQKVPPNPPGDTTTVEAALKMLQYEVTTTFKNRLVGNADYQIPQATFDALNNKQKAALISYCYNAGSLRVGIATAIKKGDLASATAQIKEGPIHSKGVVVSGLVRRRQEEATLFST